MPHRPDRRRLLAGLAAAPLAAALPARAGILPLAFSAVARGLVEPWALAFLPDGGFLVTLRGGELLRFAAAGGAPRRLGGLPAVAAVGQGGLLDVMLPADHAASRTLWLSYATPAGEGAGTALARATLQDDGLSGLAVVHRGPGTPGGRHFGARIVEGRDGTVFLTTGDRGNAALAQDPARPEGKVLAFAPDGTPRTAAAFAGQAAVPGLWSLGHRNPQGAALDASGALWLCEHGARGGDEVNRIEPGRNYGWPVISYGVDYDGSRIGEGTAKPGLEQPAHYWDPSIAPSGLLVHSGRLFAGWRGHVLTGSLKSGFISRLDPAAGWAETRIAGPQTARVRDLREAPDGSVWFLSVNTATLWRMAPA